MRTSLISFSQMMLLVVLNYFIKDAEIKVAFSELLWNFHSNVIFLVSSLKNMGQIFFHVFHAVNFVFLFRISVQFLVSSWKIWACPWCIISASNKSLFWYACVFLDLPPSIFISAIYNNSFKCSVNYASVAHWLFLIKICSISFSLSCITVCFSINILFCH